MPRFYLVDIASISCDEQRTSFDIEKLEALANAMIQVGSLLQPVVLEATSYETYRLISGALEYYAAVRASEINPDIEMVDSFVVEPGEIEQAKVQLQVLGLTATVSPPLPPPIGSNTELERRMNNMEARFDQAFQDLKAVCANQIQTLKEELKVIKDNIPQKSEPLDMFNTLSEVELMQVLRKAGIANKTAQTITKNLITARTEQLFTSYSDVVSRTKELAEKRMLAILDTWLGF